MIPASGMPQHPHPQPGEGPAEDARADVEPVPSTAELPEEGEPAPEGVEAMLVAADEAEEPVLALLAAAVPAEEDARAGSEPEEEGTAPGE